MNLGSRRLRSLAVAAVVSLVLPVGLAPEASAKTEITTVPSGASVKIEGKGFGHGRGLSQYGAQGAARSGLNYADIVEFYYPGTQWGTVSGNVKVKITADTTDDVVVKTRTKLKVRDIKGKVAHALPDVKAVEWRLQATGARTRVQYRTALKGKKATWQTWRTFAGEAQFGAGGSPMSLVLPNGRTVAYRGMLRSASPTTGGAARDTVNVVSMETYLRGVVPQEIPAAWHQEAVRAQSVAARTYATFERSAPLAKHYQICDTTQCQVYGGASVEHPLADAAIKATAKRILTYGGKAAFTQFGSSNGGWAASGSLPYQVQQADPYDGWAGNPVHEWDTTVSAAAIERAWPAVGTLQRLSVTKRTGVGDFGGRVLNLTVVGTDGKARITGDQFRSALGLRSNWLSFSAVLPRKAAKAKK